MVMRRSRFPSLGRVAVFAGGVGSTLFLQLISRECAAVASRWFDKGATWSHHKAFPPTRVAACPADHYDTEGWLSLQAGDAKGDFRAPPLRTCRTVKPAAWQSSGGSGGRLDATPTWASLGAEYSDALAAGSDGGSDLESDCLSTCIAEAPDSATRAHACQWWCRYFSDSEEVLFEHKLELIAKLVGRAVLRPGGGGTARSLIDVGGGSGMFGLVAARVYGALTTTTNAVFRWGDDGYKPFLEFISSHDLPAVVHDFTTKYPFADSSFDLLHCSWALQNVIREESEVSKAGAADANEQADAAAAATGGLGAAASAEGLLRRVLLEWDRIVRPGGLVAICVPDHEHIHGPLRTHARAMWWAPAEGGDLPYCAEPLFEKWYKRLYRRVTGEAEPALSTSQFRGGGRLLLFVTAPPGSSGRRSADDGRSLAGGAVGESAPP